MTSVDQLLAPLRADPAAAAVLCDFDGTLSPIVADPASARPIGGAAEVLDELSGRYRVVAVISGRPVSFLRSVLPASVDLVGLYGLERLHLGEPADHPEALAWRPVVARVADRALAELPAGVLVEPKGLSLTLHFRQHPDLVGDVEEWASEAAERDGLEVRAAKMSVELHPPVAVDKGTVVRSLVEGCRAACFLGDDVGDLPAFAALAKLRREGVATAALAVRTIDVAPEVLDAADLAVDGPDGALDVLRRLAAPQPAAAPLP